MIEWCFLCGCPRKVGGTRSARLGYQCRRNCTPFGSDRHYAWVALSWWITNGDGLGYNRGYEDHRYHEALLRMLALAEAS